MAYLESLGYRTRLGWSPGQATGFLAGSDETRAEDLNSAFNDPDVRGIVCAWGGYGAMRILPLLDYAALRADPKRLFGYSDVIARVASPLITGRTLESLAICTPAPTPRSVRRLQAEVRLRFPVSALRKPSSRGRLKALWSAVI